LADRMYNPERDIESMCPSQFPVRARGDMGGCSDNRDQGDWMAASQSVSYSRDLIR
jgi:hypothetical protein